jgi:hypothetical protein
MYMHHMHVESLHPTLRQQNEMQVIHSLQADGLQQFLSNLAQIIAKLSVYYAPT